MRRGGSAAWSSSSGSAQTHRCLPSSAPSRAISRTCPRATALTASSTRVATSNFSRRDLTWKFAVAALTPKRAPTSSLERPSTTRGSTALCWPVSGSICCAPHGRLAPASNTVLHLSFGAEGHVDPTGRNRHTCLREGRTTRPPLDHRAVGHLVTQVGASGAISAQPSPRPEIRGRVHLGGGRAPVVTQAVASYWVVRGSSFKGGDVP